MRHISKGVIPLIITDYCRMRHIANQQITYEDFDQKEELNNILRADQKNICCYCQQRIDHYQNKNVGGSHNEHLVP